MSFLRLLIDLQVAIDLKDTAAIEEILMKKSDLLKYPHSSSVVELVISKASSCENRQILEILIDFLSSVKSSNFEEKINLVKHLKVAISQGSYKLIKFLLKKGVDLNGPEWNGVSPAFYAFGRRNIVRKKILRLLIKHGLDTKACNSKGETLLTQFIISSVTSDTYNVLDIPTILIESGTSVNQCDNAGCSPLVRAISKENIKLIKFLLEKETDVTQRVYALYIALKLGNKVIVDLLFSNGTCINDKNPTHKTAMHLACYYHEEKAIDWAIRLGADISAKTIQGTTPLALLRPNRDNYEQCLLAIVKEFSKHTFDNVPLCEIDAILIQSKPKARETWEKCMGELHEMSSDKFYPPYSYYSVLKMSRRIKRLSHLTRNEEFVTNFKTNLDKFVYYKDDLQRIFQEATKVRIDFDKIKSKLDRVLGDCFPDLVIRKLTDNLNVIDTLSMNYAVKRKRVD